MANNRRTKTKDNVLILGGPGGAYQAEVIRQGLKLPPGRLYHVDIYHDSSCSIWSGGECDCDPVVRVEPIKIDSLLHSNP